MEKGLRRQGLTWSVRSRPAGRVGASRQVDLVAGPRIPDPVSDLDRVGEGDVEGLVEPDRACHFEELLTVIFCPFSTRVQGTYPQTVLSTFKRTDDGHRCLLV